MDLALAVLLGVGFLFVFYRAIQADWPERYFAANDVSAYAISTSPLRYSLFRLGPTFVVCVFVAVMLDRRGAEGPLGAILVSIVHASLTLGWALAVWARSNAALRRSTLSIALFRAVTFAGVVIMGVAAAITFRSFSGFVPSLQELSAGWWTAVLAGIAAAFVLRFTKGHPLNEYELVQRSLYAIPRALLDLAANLAKSAGADAVLACALIVVENIERPRWFRGFERVKAKFVRSGTYGIMQVASDRPLTDEDSIAKVVSERLVGVNVSTPKGEPDTTALRTFASRYNRSENFAGLLVAAYYAVQVWRKSSSG